MFAYEEKENSNDYNPLVLKLLPFPYGVNKMITDYLTRDKKLYLSYEPHKIKLEIELSQYLEGLDDRYVNNRTGIKFNGKECITKFDYCIRDNRYEDIFGRRKENIIISNIKLSLQKHVNLFSFPSGIHPHLDAMVLFYDTFMNSKLLNQLEQIEDNLYNRENQEITVDNEIEIKTFKIFNKKKGISSKPYLQFLNFVKEYVDRKTLEYHNLLTTDCVSDYEEGRCNIKRLWTPDSHKKKIKK